MQQTIALSLLSLAALSGTAFADAIHVIQPGVVASIHDEPVDGLGDQFNLTPFEGMIRFQTTRADRAVHEYDIAVFTGPTVGIAQFNGRVSVNNAADNGVRTFDFIVYDANGTAELGDYQISGVVVGTGSYHPPIDSFFDYHIDATAAVQALVTAGATHIGLRVEATSNPSFPNILDAANATLEMKDGPILTAGAFCFGDGSGTACPCANPGGPGAGCANSAGAQGASMSSFGSFSVSNFSGAFTSNGLVPNQPGLYFQGDNSINGGQGVIFGDGLRCAGGSVIRLEIAVADAGGASGTTGNLAAIAGVVAGETKRYQCWYRDPSGSPCGSGFNLTNGIELTWTP